MLRTHAILQVFGFRAFALHPHTCCLRNRIQSLTHASRVTILSAFSKSLYSKRPYDKSCHILYKASCSVASQLSQLPHVTDFVGLSRRSPHRFTLCVSGCGSLPAHIRIPAGFHTAPCSYMLASFKHAVFCACFACPKTARLTTALYTKKTRGDDSSCLLVY